MKTTATAKHKVDKFLSTTPNYYQVDDRNDG